MRSLTFLSGLAVALTVVSMACAAPTSSTQAPGAGTVPGSNEPYSGRAAATTVAGPEGSLPTSNPNGPFSASTPIGVTDSGATPISASGSDSGANGPRGVNTTSGANTGNAATPGSSAGLGAGPGAGQSPAVSVTLSALNNSGETGAAMLTDIGSSRTRVDLRVEGGTGSEPAHIHDGTCANIDPTPHYPLSNVQNGMSTTEVPVSVSDLTTGSFAINVHKSDAEMDVDVACGDIPAR